MLYIFICFVWYTSISWSWPWKLALEAWKLEAWKLEADPGSWPWMLSLGKWFGSKGKQHHKHTASETQSHSQWSRRMQITNHRKCQNQLRPGISTSMSTTYLCLPNTACHWNIICYYRISQLGPRNGAEYSLLSVCLCLACGSASKSALETWGWWGCCR